MRFSETFARSGWIFTRIAIAKLWLQSIPLFPCQIFVPQTKLTRSLTKKLLSFFQGSLKISCFPLTLRIILATILQNNSAYGKKPVMVYTQLGAGIVLEHVDQISFIIWYFHLSLMQFVFHTFGSWLIMNPVCFPVNAEFSILSGVPVRSC